MNDLQQMWGNSHMFAQALTVPEFKVLGQFDIERTYSRVERISLAITES